MTSAIPGPLLLEADADAVLFVDGRIRAVGDEARASASPGAERLTFDGARLAPGLIELQINGGWGHDFTEQPAAIWEVGERLPARGVTAFLPTLVSATDTEIEAALDVLRRGPPPGYLGADPLGLHLEGPFINSGFRGAHPAPRVRPVDGRSAEGWRPPQVRMVTLAPELPGAVDLVGLLVRRGVLAAAGHTAAGPVDVRRAADAGLRYATHLFNAMAPRDEEPAGTAGHLLDEERVAVGLICDGLHVAPQRVAAVWRRVGAGRLSLVSDAMAALGLGPGSYTLAGAAVTVDVSSARVEGGMLAGSIIGLDDALRNVAAFTGCSPADALRAATAVPARLLGLRDRGVLAPGARGDAVVLDDGLRVLATFVGGRPAYRR